MNAKPRAASSPKRWQCMVCGYIHEGSTPPKQCPKCGAPAEDFTILKAMIGREQDAAYDTLLECDDPRCSTGDIRPPAT